MAERKPFIEKVTEFSKKVDYFLIGSGIVLLYFIPNVGAALIIGSAITIIPAEMIERWSKSHKK